MRTNNTGHTGENALFFRYFRSISRSIGAGIAVTGLASGAACAQIFEQNLTEDIMRYSSRTDMLDQRITGPGKDSSFNLPGRWLLHEGEYRRALPLSSGWHSDFNLSYRLTDSTQFDSDKLSIQKLEWQLKDATRKVNIGDYYANFSQYSMSRSIKGLAFQLNFDDDRNYVRAAYGSFDSRWAYLHRSNNLNEPMDRHGGGIRLQRTLDKFQFGFNLSHLRDIDDDPRRGATQDAYQQTIGAFDWEYREPGMVLSGEHAFAATDTMPVGQQKQKSSGTANKIVFRGSLKDINIDANLEQVTPRFQTFAGGATPDRFRAYLRADARIARLWKVFGVADYSRNNLTGLLASTNFISSYEAGVTRRRAFDRRTLTISASLRHRITDTSAATGNKEVTRYKLRVNDTFFGKLNTRAFYEDTIDVNKVPNPNTRASDRLFGISFDTRYETPSKWVLQPMFEVSRQEAQVVTAGGSDVFEVVRLGLTGDNGNGTQTGFNYEYNTSKVTAVLGNSQRNRLNAYWQTKPKWLDNGHLRFELLDNINSFADSTRNFKEKILKATLQFDLERIGGERK